MAVSYSTALKTDRMTAVLDKIDAAVGAGTIEIGSAGFAATLAVITLEAISGSVTTDTLTFASFPKSDTNTTAGTAAEARIKDGDGNIVVSGLIVGTAATDIVLDSVTTNAAGTLTLNSATIVHG